MRTVVLTERIAASKTNTAKPSISNFKTVIYQFIAMIQPLAKYQVGFPIYKYRIVYGRWCMCGRPIGCKRKSEKSDGRVDCDHVSGLVDAAP